MENEVPFWKSKAFWIFVVTLAAGVLLVLTGHDDIGQILILGGAAGGGVTAMVKGGKGPGATATGAALLLLCAVSCTPHMAFVESERAVYDALAPEYVNYVRADPSLTSEQVRMREDMVKAWLVSIEAAGGVRP